MPLNASSSPQDAAAFLAAKFFTRPEIVGRHLPAFVEFCKVTVRDAAADDFLKMGCLKGAYTYDVSRIFGISPLLLVHIWYLTGLPIRLFPLCCFDIKTTVVF